MNDDPGPIVQRLILGERLRTLRESSGIALDDANAYLGWYRGKLSKIENGTLGLTDRELSTLLSYYRVPGPEAAQVKQLGTEARRKAAPERVNDWAKQYIPLERAASEIRLVYNEIPGLLQTKASARAQLIRSPVVLAADVDDMAAAREERGNRLYGDKAPRVWAVLGEEALLRRVGAPHEMRAQLERLREMALLSTMSLRVMPLTHGPYAGLSCPFTLLWIERARTTIAYVETLTGADYVKSTKAYSLAFDQAHEDALSEEETLILLDQYIADLD
ncbi:helix-turn-helix domain-containing protein [Actinopolyspora mortivallis]|uniref:helix-turn-helix domain-containing protein n=1 Tax=Actinopolyspora mortivallis TaxID=33906 RepID=UPI0009FECDEE|nr:helix-turn-helix transcriptional regulator [Actinopolyspora mortivallis]